MTVREPNVVSPARRTTPRFDPPQALTDEVLQTPVDGHQLRGNTLAELIDDHTTLLVFLRHFG